MCEKLNKYLSDRGTNVRLDFNSIVRTYTQGMIRERHLAKALREEVFKHAKNEEERSLLLTKIFGNREVIAQMGDHAALENEIRNNLLKAGGAAFIAENPESFLSVGMIKEIILHGGGIPAYPMLADDRNGDFTEFEQDKLLLAAALKDSGIHAIEFISTRNSPEVLMDYAAWFFDKGFIVTFGSEHNTPQLTPIQLYTRNGDPLSEKMRWINYQGACLIAAHQYLFTTKGVGYLDERGTPFDQKAGEYRYLGNTLIQHYLFNKTTNE
jgi:hypothetical protein